MNKWVSGQSDTAAKVDPTVAAILLAVANLIVTLELHIQLGLTAEQVLDATLQIGFIATLVRSLQLNIRARRRPPLE